MWALLPFASSPEHRLPLIQFLFIGSRVCSTLPSDLASRLGPFASLSLHVHHVVKRTFTSKLSIMLGTPKRRGRRLAPPFPLIDARLPPFTSCSGPCRRKGLPASCGAARWWCAR